MKVTLGHRANFQLIFAGPYGVGKTTALQTISDIPVANTDVKSLEATEQLKKQGKTTTTVGMDYGELHLPDKTVVALMGLPGQSRFKDMWDILLNKHTGVLLWLYGDAEQPLEECKSWLDILHKRGATGRLAVVITRLPIPTPNELLQPYRELIRNYNPYAPVICADPRKREQVIQTVLMAVGTPAFKR